MSEDARKRSVGWKAVSLSLAVVVALVALLALGAVRGQVLCSPLLLPVACGSTQELFSGRIRLAGVVVDEDGNALKDVTLVIGEGRFNPAAESFRSRSERRKTINGRFDESCRMCSGLTLMFMKNGYFEEVISFAATSEELDKEPERDGGSATDLRIVLMSNVGSASLVRIGGGLSAGVADRLDILRVEPATGRRIPSRVALIGGKLFAFTSPRKDQTETTPLDVPFLYLTSRAGLGGTFETTTAKHPSSEVTVSGVPAEVLLCASREGDGFVLYEPRRDVSHLAYREMREAPADGYQRCIPAPIWPAERPKLFFYCKVGSLYGKGEVSTAAFSGFVPGEVEAHVSILINRNGTRNVAGYT